MDSRVELNSLKLSKPALKGLPIAYVDEKRGPDHAQEWRATCHLGGYSRLGSHWYTNKDDARKDAASNMITLIRYVGTRYNAMNLRWYRSAHYHHQLRYPASLLPIF